MDARFNQDLDITITADKELIVCPLSKKIIRHPLLTSDGVHYEALELLKHFRAYSLTSPQSGEPITSATYDRQLKYTIDRNYANAPGRYETYDTALALDQIQSMLGPKAVRTSQFEHIGFFATVAKIPAAIMSIAACGMIGEDLVDEQPLRYQLD